MFRDCGQQSLGLTAARLVWAELSHISSDTAFLAHMENLNNTGETSSTAC